MLYTMLKDNYTKDNYNRITKLERAYQDEILDMIVENKLNLERVEEKLNDLIKAIRNNEVFKVRNILKYELAFKDYSLNFCKIISSLDEVQALRLASHIKRLYKRFTEKIIFDSFQHLEDNLNDILSKSKIEL